MTYRLVWSDTVITTPTLSAGRAALEAVADQYQ
jgi:hypothetical protein